MDICNRRLSICDRKKKGEGGNTLDLVSGPELITRSIWMALEIVQYLDTMVVAVVIWWKFFSLSLFIMILSDSSLLQEAVDAFFLVIWGQRFMTFGYWIAR